MALVEKTVIVPHSAVRMFDLVDRVQDYPQFMPWCGGATVDKLEGDTMHATLHIDYHHIKQRFSTENRRSVPNRISMTLLDGPFRHLDGEWLFTALSPDACKIVFRLHYEFSSKVLEKLVGPVFSHITNTFVDAFIQRAEKVYTTP